MARLAEEAVGEGGAQMTEDAREEGAWNAGRNELWGLWEPPAGMAEVDRTESMEPARERGRRGRGSGLPGL